MGILNRKKKAKPKKAKKVGLNQDDFADYGEFMKAKREAEKK